MSRSMRWPLVAILCLSLPLAACGDGEDDDDDTDIVEDAGDGGGGGDTTPDAEPTPDPDVDPEPDAEPDTTPDVTPDVDPDIDLDVDPDVDLDVDPDVEPDVDPDVDPDTVTPCDPGFVLEGEDCVDIDECATATSNCDTNASCTNTEGSFECACNEGFFGDGVVCVDNPCVIYAPGSFERPDDTPDTVDCLAPSVCLARGAGGPLYNALAETADEAPGCGELGPSGTEWAPGPCEGNEGPFTGFVDATGCSPRSAVGRTLCLHVLAEDLYYNVRFTGFTGGGSGGGFAYDRQLVGGGICSIGATCAFDRETAETSCTCTAGTEGDGTVECLDIDECALGIDDCTGDAVCVNTYGGYDCACPDGYTFDDALNCVDIDECDAGTDTCDDTATCVNTDGGFDCTCDAFNTLVDGTTCVDIDECVLGTDTCGDNATCTNRIGDGFDCTCRDGFTGDGETCTSILACDPGCGVNGVCIVNVAAFDGGAGAGEAPANVCVCQPGYTGDGFTCVDVDECSDADTVRIDLGPDRGPDCITPGVCLARPADGGAFYNAAIPGDEVNADCPDEGGFLSRGNPTGTRWALGNCSDDELDFTTLSGLWGCGIGRNIVGTPLCLEITETGQRTDLTVLYWGGSGTDGAVIYERIAANPCDTSATCENTEGGVSCVCDEEFVGDGFECTFAGPCDLDCGTNGECALDRRGPVCVCDPGYALEEGTCTDVDECVDRVEIAYAPGLAPDCLSDDVCLARSAQGGSLFNSLVDRDPAGIGCEGAPYPTGTRWAPGSCDDDELRFAASFLEAADCSGTNVEGSTFCVEVLSTGERLTVSFSEWGRSQEGTAGTFQYTRDVASGCSANASCTNEDGGVTCACNDGFTGDGSSCAPIPACDPGCEANETCVVEGGASVCECAPGFAEGEGGCEDTDACAAALPRSVTYTPGDAPVCLTPSVCLVRSADGGGVFNGLVDDSAGDTPFGTEWADGRCSPSNPVFTTLRGVALGNFPGLVGRDLCMHAVEDGVFLDVRFESWASGRTSPEAERGSFGLTYFEGLAAVRGDNATCIDLPSGAFDCACPEGFTGDPFVGCVSIDDCAGDPCGAGNTCVDQDGGFACVCEGQTIDFLKTPFGTEEDCISSDVCISRADVGPIYNTLVDPRLDDSTGCGDTRPAGTLWKFGACDSFAGYSRFLGGGFADCGPPSIVDRPACLLLTDSNVTLDLTFTAWGQGGTDFTDFGLPVPFGGGTSTGGTFAYTREVVTFNEACPAP